MGDENRVGFVIALEPEGLRFIAGASFDGKVSVVRDPTEAILFLDRKSAAACFRERCDVNVMTLADAIVAATPKTLGQIAIERAKVCGFPNWATDGGRDDDWESIMRMGARRRTRQRRLLD